MSPTPICRTSQTPGADAGRIGFRIKGAKKIEIDANGNLVAAVGPNGGSDTVYEGDLGRPSMLEGREIIYNVGMAEGTYGLGQKPGTDGVWGAQSAHVPFYGNTFQSLAGTYSPQVLPLEIPAWQNSFIKYRAKAEENWQSEDQVTVFATMQGWLRPSGGLWQRNQSVNVVSPMLVMDGGMSLTAKSVTFTQDNQTGSRTTLELCNNAALAGLIPQGPGGG